MNTPIPKHPLIGTEHVYKPDMPNTQHLTDPRYVARCGDHVTVIAVFHDWNDVPGLTILYVHVNETGHSTHFSVGELGIEYDPATMAVTS
jgi:hypothetical protein